MTNSTRRLAASATAIVLVGLLISACGRSPDETSADSTVVVQTIGPDNVAVAREDTIRSGPPISGTLVAEREARIRAEVAGAVLQTYVEQGQRVVSGAVLGRIDDAVAKDALLSARSQMTQATLASEQAARELQRARTLVAAGAIAERDVESAERANLAAQAQLADAKARLGSAEKVVENSTVRAPFAGIVAERSVNPGDIVSPGTALFTVVDPRSLKLEASVPTASLADVRIGAPVAFSVNGFAGRTLTGHVTRINPVVDPQTRQVRLLASIPNLQGSLVAGLFVEGRIESEKHVGVVVPEQALDQAAQNAYVIRLRGGKIERVAVQVGLRDPSRETIEIREGVVAGDTILLGAARSISAGASVKVSSPTDAQTKTVPAPAVDSASRANGN